RKVIKIPYYAEIMRNGLAKSYARIDYYLTPLYPVLDGKLHALFQKCYYLRDNAFINGIDLHCTRSAKHVHHDDRRPRFSGDPRHSGIEPQGTHVVDYVGARCKRLERHVGLIGIYRYWDVAAFTHRPDDWNYPIEFYRQRDRVRSGSCRFAPNIQDVCPRRDQLKCPGERPLIIGE